jgi:hypothetical protein
LEQYDECRISLAGHARRMLPHDSRTQSFPSFHGQQKDRIPWQEMATVKQRILVASALLWFGFTPAIAQESGHVPVSMVQDWSSRHMIFSEDVPREARGAMLAEPRFWQQYLRRHAERPQAVFEDEGQREYERDHGRDRDRDRDRDSHDHRKRHRKAASQRDWSFSLGGGSGGRISGPAKFVFDVTAAPSCTTDFVVTGIAANGAANQANIIGLNRLYTNPAGTGFCPGTGPAVMFAYNVGAGQVPSLVALSLNGQKIAFSENNTAAGTSNFHVLQFKTGAGNGTSATAPAVPGTGNTAIDVRLPLAGASVTGPFVDYAHDVAYVTTTNVVHKFSGVFNGTPAEVTTGGWPATITGPAGVSTPVYDNVSRHVFVTDVDGFIDYIDDSVSPAVVHSQTFSISTGGTAAPVVVDSSRQKVYAFQNGNNAVAAQGDTNLTAGSRVVVSIGANSGSAVLEGDFNNAYYSGGASPACFLYVVGNDSTNRLRPALFNIGFDATFKLNTTTANGPLALSAGNTTGALASPITEFYNSRLAKDFMFVGISAACQVQGGSGCIRSLDITGGFPAAGSINNVILNASGGTGTITVDNNNVAAAASSVYYTSQSGNNIVKATQAALQ